jgi:hypothetical protein
MSVDGFIQEAIARGEQEGVRALDPASAMVFLISEAEVMCDKDGIDSFVDTYGAPGLSDAAWAFDAVGATSIADGLQRLADAAPALPESLLDVVNRLITDRCGYDYEAIAQAIERLQQISSVRNSSG